MKKPSPCRHAIVIYSVFWFFLTMFLADCAISPKAKPEPDVVTDEPQPGQSAESALLGVPEPVTIEKAIPPKLTLTFAGDIMAHRCNYSMAEYDRIYDDLREFLQSDDLSFANLEMPVDDDLPLSTYPLFNVHSPYVEAAVAGGFDVFSLANNHANDQGTDGMGATLAALSSIPGISGFSGLRSSFGESMAPSVIHRGGTDAVFLAVTEILNAYDASKDLTYYVAPRESARVAFLENLKTIRADYPTALFVLSVHLNEPEYVTAVAASKREWFARIAEVGVDVIWAHHPHVMQEWEILERGGRESLIMYSMGNFISGQRWDENRADPSGYREYTGDAVLLRVIAERESITDGADSWLPGFRFAVMPLAITNWKDPTHGMVVKKATESFIESLSDPDAAYYRARWRLMGEYLPVSLLPD